MIEKIMYEGKKALLSNFYKSNETKTHIAYLFTSSRPTVYTRVKSGRSGKDRGVRTATHPKRGVVWVLWLEANDGRNGVHGQRDIHTMALQALHPNNIA
jgi:hypothetical protein